MVGCARYVADADRDGVAFLHHQAQGFGSGGAQEIPYARSFARCHVEAAGVVFLEGDHRVLGSDTHEVVAFKHRQQGKRIALRDQQEELVRDFFWF